MKKVWLLFSNTLWNHVWRWGYALVTFGLPVFLLVLPVVLVGLLGAALVAVWPEPDRRPVGVVDETGDFSQLEGSSWLLFEDEHAAATALHNGSIQAYYQIPADYWATGAVNAVYETPPSIIVELLFTEWMEEQVSGRVPPDVFALYKTPITFEHEQSPTPEESGPAPPASTRLAQAGQGLMGIFIAVYLVRFGSMFTTATVMESITSESDNRTIEIILTILSPGQFVVGKFMALLLAGLFQMGVWLGLLSLIALTIDAFSPFNLWEIVAEWPSIWPAVWLLLGMYVLDQIMGAAAGLLRVSSGIGYQIIGLLGWITTLGLIYALSYVPLAPDAPLSVITSLFPLTSPIVMLVRLHTGTVPNWQVNLSIGLLWVSILLMVINLRFLLRLNLLAYARRWHLREWLRQRKVISKK